VKRLSEPVLVFFGAMSDVKKSASPSREALGRGASRATGTTRTPLSVASTQASRRGLAIAVAAGERSMARTPGTSDDVVSTGADPVRSDARRPDALP